MTARKDVWRALHELPDDAIDELVQHAIGREVYGFTTPIRPSILTNLGLSKATASGIPHAIGAMLDDYKRRAPSTLEIVP